MSLFQAKKCHNFFTTAADLAVVNELTTFVAEFVTIPVTISDKGCAEPPQELRALQVGIEYISRQLFQHLSAFSVCPTLVIHQGFKPDAPIVPTRRNESFPSSSSWIWRGPAYDQELGI